MGKQSFDDTMTPQDSVITALLTFGEGYHNFHHEYPADYRNAIKGYQYDPTKWFILLCHTFGLVYDLNRFPDAEIQRALLDMEQRSLDEAQERLDQLKQEVNYGPHPDDL